MMWFNKPARHRRTIATAVLALLVAACGGGVSDEDAADEIVDELLGDLADEISEGLDAEPDLEGDTGDLPDLPDPVTRVIGKTGWWGGFAITVDQVVAEAVSGEAIEVKLDISFENLGEDAAEPPSATLQGRDGVVFDTFDTLPSIAGAGSATGSVGFWAEPSQYGAEVSDLEAAMDGLTLVYGESGDNQTIIPLGPGEVVTFEPIAFDVTGQAAHGDVVATFTTASLAPSYRSGEAGSFELILANPSVVYDCASECNAVGFAVDRRGFALTSPSGASVTVADNSEFCCLSGHAGEVVDDGDMTFIVSEPVEGAYSLAITLDTIGVGGDVSGSEPEPLVFDVP
jgi:hypothetical protein